MTVSCTCDTDPLDYCPMHGCPHPTSNGRWCDCPSKLGECTCVINAITNEVTLCSKHIAEALAQEGRGKPTQAHDPAKVDLRRVPKCAECPYPEYTPCDPRRTECPAGAIGRTLVAAEADEPDMVNHPPHYSHHASGVEAIEITRHLSFDIGNAVKYVYRTEAKNGRQDLEKAQWYLRDALDAGTAPFLPSWNFRVSQLLDRVLAVETDHHRLLFFIAVKRGDVALALEAVTDMLDTD